MKVQKLRKLLSLAERPATGLNLPQISFNAEATQISKRICRNSGRGQLVSHTLCHRTLHQRGSLRRSADVCENIGASL